MKKENFFSKITVMMAVFGLIMIGVVEAQTDNRLNGRWFVIDDEIELEYNLNNGNYESTTNGISYERGTYTTNNGVIIFSFTHVFCGNFMFDEMRFTDLELRWYTKNEFIAHMGGVYGLYGFSLSEIDEIKDAMNSAVSKANYSLNANTLTLIYITEDESVPITFTKK